VEIFNLLFSSINKLSFVVFLIALGFFCYEFFLLVKEKEKKSKPQIPAFNIKDFDKKDLPPVTTQIISRKSNSITTRINVHIILAIILFFMTTFFFFLSIISIKSTKQAGSGKTEIIYSEVQSNGIKVFTDHFLRELSMQEINQLPSGTKIIIGVESIKDTDIDRARIKINEKDWHIKHITTLFDKANNVFYTNYIIATGETKLSIDAQLHSFNDGWLGD
jgi:hypothetical protein